MVFDLFPPPNSLSMLPPIPIGLVAAMISDLPVVMQFFLRTTSFPGQPRNKYSSPVQHRIRISFIGKLSTELVWIQLLLCELGLFLPAAPILWCENIGATYLTANPVFHERTKHVEINFHFVRGKVARKDLDVRFLSTKDQIADVFTKALPSARFQFLQNKLRVQEPH